MVDDPFAFIEEDVAISRSQEQIFLLHNCHIKAQQSHSSDDDDGSINSIPKHCGGPPIVMLSLSDSTPQKHKLNSSMDDQGACAGSNVVQSDGADGSVPSLLRSNRDPALWAAAFVRRLPSSSGRGRAKHMAFKKKHGRGLKLRRSVTPPDLGTEDIRDMDVDHGTKVLTDTQSTVNEETKQLAKNIVEEIGDLNVEHDSKLEIDIKSTLNEEGMQLTKNFDEEIGDMSAEHGSKVEIDIQSIMNEEGNHLNNIVDERIGDMEVVHASEVETNVQANEEEMELKTKIQSPLAEVVKVNEEDDTMGINSLMDVINLFPSKPDPFEGVDILDILKAKGIVIPKPSWWHEGFGLEVFEDEE